MGDKNAIENVTLNVIENVIGTTSVTSLQT
jgi:hypothetical protein